MFLVCGGFLFLFSFLGLGNKGRRVGGETKWPTASSSCPVFAKGPRRTQQGADVLLSLWTPLQKGMALFMRITTRSRDSLVGGATLAPAATRRDPERERRLREAGLGRVQRHRVGSLRPRPTTSWNAACFPGARLFPSPSVGSAGSAPVARPGVLSTAPHSTPPARQS